MNIPGVAFNNVDYKGRIFTGPYFVATDPAHGPGWYVWGREPNGVIMNVARPEGPSRKHPHYNMRVTRGFRTQREAKQIAAMLSTYKNPRPRLGAAKPKRASTATGKAPSKRLVARRTRNTRKGYFPNPRVPVFDKSKGARGKVGYAVHSASQPYYNAIAWFSTLAEARDTAQEAADRTGKPLKVTKAPFYY